MSQISLISGQSAITTDQYGVAHVVWYEGPNLWSANYDANSQSWTNAQIIADIGTQQISNIQLIANSGLINQGSSAAPGLAVVYQSGNGNSSNLYYVAANYGSNNQLQWLNTPVAITSDQLADLNPTVVAYQPNNNTGSPTDNTANLVVLGEKANSNSLQEGSNIYAENLTIKSSQFTPSSTIAPSIYSANYDPSVNLQKQAAQGLPYYGLSQYNVPDVTADSLVATPAASTPGSSSGSTSSQTQGINIFLTFNTVLNGLEYIAIDSNNSFKNLVEGIVAEILNLKLKLQGILRYRVNPFNGNQSLQAFDQILIGDVHRDPEFGDIKTSIGISSVANTQYFWSKAQKSNFSVPASESSAQGITLSAGFGFDLEIGYLGMNFNVGYADGFAGVPNPAVPNYKQPSTYIVPVLIASAGFATEGALLPSPANAPFVSRFIIASQSAASTNMIAAKTDPSLFTRVNWFQYEPLVEANFVGKLGLPFVNVQLRDLAAYSLVSPGSGSGYNQFTNILYVGFQVALLNIGYSYTWSVRKALKGSNYGNNNNASPNASPNIAQSSLGTASVSNTLLTLSDISFNTQILPTASEFTVTESTPTGNVNYQVLNVFIQNGNLVLQLAQPIPVSENQDYTTGEANPPITNNPISVSYSGTTLVDNSGNVIAPFTDSVVNNSPNVATATYNPQTGNASNTLATIGGISGAALYFGNSSSTNSNQIIIVANQGIVGTPNASQFTLTDTTNNQTYSVNAVSINNNIITLTTNSPISAGDVFQVSYSASNSVTGSVSGQAIPSFSNYGVVTNNSTSPSIIGSTVTSSGSIELVFNQALTGTPSVSDFSVNNTTNGTTLVPVTISSVASSGANIVTLTPQYSLSAGTSYQVAYTGNLIAGASLLFSSNTASSSNQIVIVTNKPIEGTASVSDFTITDTTAGAVYNPNTVTYSNNIITLTTSAPINAGDTLKFSYSADSNVTNSAGVEIPSLNSYTINTTNNSTNPSLIGSSVTNTGNIELVFNKALTGTVNASEFTVTNQTVTGASYSNNVLTLTLSSPATIGSSYAISYKGNSTSTQGSLTNVGSFSTNVSVPIAQVSNPLLSNIVGALGPDTTPSLAPTPDGNQLLGAWISDSIPLNPIAGIIINGNQILLNYIANVQNNSGGSVLQASQFSVSINGASAVTPTGAQLQDGNVELQLANSLSTSDTVQVTYTPASVSSANDSTNNLYLHDAEGGILWLPESNTTITGSSTTTAPELLGAASLVKSDGTNLLTLVFNQLLGSPTSDFTVTSNGQNYIVTGTAINNNVVQLIVTPPVAGSPLIGESSVVTVSYNGTDLLGIGGVSFSIPQPVQTTSSNPTTVVKWGLGPSGNSFTTNPASIPGTSGLNFSPVAGLDPISKENVIVWVNADTSNVSNSGLLPGQAYANQNVISNSNIYYSIDSGADNSWTLAAAIPNQIQAPAGQNNTVGQLTLGTGPNGELMAAWIDTLSSATTGAAISTTIYYSELSKGTWSTPSVVLSGFDPYPVTNLVISQVGGQPAIFATQMQPTPYVQLVNNNSPIIFFELDDPSGSTSANDLGSNLVGNGYSGNVTFGQTSALYNTSTKTGDPNPSVTFKPGSSLSTNSFSLNGNTFSVDFWFNVPNLSQGAVNLVSLSGIGSISLNSDGLLNLNILQPNGSSINLTSAVAVTADNWNYVAVTFDGQQASLYLNGSPLATQANLNLPSYTTSLTIANNADATVSLDEVAVYTSVLTYSNQLPPNNQLTNQTTSQQINAAITTSNNIGQKYQAQYNKPIPPGPDTQSVVWNGSSWSSQPQHLRPTPTPVATALGSSINPTWDVVSNSSNNSSTNVAPDGVQDQLFDITLTNQQNNQITGIEISNGTSTWAVGTNNSTALIGNQLAVVQNGLLLNSQNPKNDDTFSSWVLGTTANYSLYVDNGNSGQITNATITFYFADGYQYQTTSNSITDTSANSSGSSGKTSAIATVTEAQDNSVANIDSGFVVQTNNPNIGYVMASGTNNGTNNTTSYVAVGNRGYSDISGNPIQSGTVQIIFNNGTLFSNLEQGIQTNPLDVTDLKGNPGGILIEGLADNGIASGQSAISMATGNVLGSGGGDLIIGDPNNNTVYVISGSYIAANGSAIIDVNNLTSTQGYVIPGPSATSTNNPNFGYSVAAGNFNGSSNETVVIGTPGYDNGEGAVYLYNFSNGSFVQQGNILQGSPNSQTTETFGFSLNVSHYNGKGTANTFNGSTNDVLFVGAPEYNYNVANYWSGASNLSQSDQAQFSNSSNSTAGSVYGFYANSSNQINTTAGLILTGSNAANNQTGNPSNEQFGVSITSGDYNGDGIQDLAIGAPYGNLGQGQVFVYAGSSTNWTANTTPQVGSNLAALVVNQSVPNSVIGLGLASPGDLTSTDNGIDPLQDLLITAPQAGNGTGQSYLLFGGSGGLDFTPTSPQQTIDLNPAATTNKSDLLLNGTQPQQLAGSAAAGVGLVDNQPSLLISSPGANQLGLVYGKSYLNDLGSLSLADLSSVNGSVISGYQGNFSLILAPSPTNSNINTLQLVNNSSGVVLWQSNNTVSAVQAIMQTDGNFVLNDSSGNAVWSTGTSGNSELALDGAGNLEILSLTTGSVLKQLYGNYTSSAGSTQTLTQGNSIYQSAFPLYQLSLTSNGGLQLINALTGQQAWQATNTNGQAITGANQAIMQSDGSFVLENSSGNILWSTTNGQPGAYLALDNSGNLQVLSSSGTVLDQLNGTYNSDYTTSNLASGSSLNSSSSILYSSPSESGNIALVSPTSYAIPGNGTNVAMLGDINGDGYGDVASAGSANGAVIVFGHSTADLTSPTATSNLLVTIQGATVENIVALGDVNGDGLDSFGVLGSDNNFYVVYGNGALEAQGSLVLNSAYSGFGYQVIKNISSAVGDVGDVNGDGYSDAILNNNLYLGGVDGLSASSDPVPSGSTLAGAGDVNGDGYQDLIAGSPTANSNNGSVTVQLSNGGTSTTITPPSSVPSSGTASYDSSSWYSYSSNLANTTSNYQISYNPSLVVWNGLVYMAYTGSNGDIIIQNSSDGVHWNNATDLGSNFRPGPALRQSPNLTVFKNTLYLGFTNSDNVIAITPGTTTNSPGLGVSFSDSNLYTIDQSSGSAPELIEFAEGLYCFYQADNSSGAVLYVYSKNPTSSGNWTTDYAINENSNENITASVLNDTLYVAFHATNSNDLLIANSTGGSDWSANTVVNSGTYMSASMTTGSDGNLYIAFESDPGSNLEVATSSNGTSWTSAQVGSVTAPTGAAAVAFNNGVLVATTASSSASSSLNYSISNRLNYSTVLQMGGVVSTIGDFNGDGFKDVAVLLPGYISGALSSNNTTLAYNGGMVLVYYGSSSGINQNPNVALTPPAATSNYNNYYLTNIAQAGDVNGDGYDDLLIGSETAPNPPTAFAPPSNPNSGQVDVVFGGPASQWSTYTASNPYYLGNLNANQPGSNLDSHNYGFSITGLPASQLGITMSGGSDVNGDGISDIVLGAPGNSDSLSYNIFGSNFTNAITQVGTIGDDVMIGTATGDDIVAGTGNDTIITNGGRDVVYAGPSDDLVSVSDTTFQRLDGGSGINILKFEGYTNEDWNLTTLSPGDRLKNFEVIDIIDYGNNILTLNSLVVTNLSPSNSISVIMDSGDTLSLSSDFSYQGVIYNQQIRQYEYEYTASNSAAVVYVIEPTKPPQSASAPAPTNVNLNAPSTLSPTINSPQSDSSATPTATINSAKTGSDQPAKIYVSSPFTSKANGEVYFTIERTGDINQYLGVDYSTSDKTGKAGIDYYPTAGELVFAPGEMTKVIGIKLPPNTTYTGTKQFSLNTQITQQTSTAIEPYQVQLTNTNGSAIRYFTEQSSLTQPLPNDPINPLTSPVGEQDFYITANKQGYASLSFNVTGDPNVNGIYVLNAQGNWINFVYNGSTGAQITHNGDGSSTVNLTFQDGGRGDADKFNNGVIQVKMAVTDSPLTPLVGTPLKDTLTGNQLIGLGGGDSLTGSVGVANEFYYTGLNDTGSIITNFKAGADRINLTEVLNSIGYKGKDPILDHVVGFKHIASGTFVTIDTDGLGLKDTAHNFAFVKGVSEISLSNPNNFVF